MVVGMVISNSNARVTRIKLKSKFIFLKSKWLVRVDIVLLRASLCCRASFLVFDVMGDVPGYGAPMFEFARAHVFY